MMCVHVMFGSYNSGKPLSLVNNQSICTPLICCIFEGFFLALTQRPGTPVLACETSQGFALCISQEVLSSYSIGSVSYF